MLLGLVGAVGPVLAAPDLAALQESVGAAFRAARVPGAAVALVRRGEPAWIQTYGHRRRGGPEVTEDTLFRGASLSKVFLALAAMQLAERRQLDLEARWRDVAPEVALDNPWGESHPVRLVHLLEHTSGLWDMHYDEVFAHDGDERRPAAQLLGRGHQPFEVRWPPGTRVAYSNRGAAMLAYLLEKETGRPFEEVVRAEVLEPLGLQDTRFSLGQTVEESADSSPTAPGPPSPEGLGRPAESAGRVVAESVEEARARLAEGYLEVDGPPAPYLPTWFRPASNVLTSARDLAALTQMFVDRGARGGRAYLRNFTLLRMENPGTGRAAAAGVRVGFAAGLTCRSRRGFPALGHYGGGWAYRSAFRYFPDLGGGYVVMTSTSDARGAFHQVQDLLYDALLDDRAEPEAPRAPLDPDDRARLPGWYQPGNPRHQQLAFFDQLVGGYRLTVDGDALVAAGVTGKTRRLIPTGRGRFRFEDEHLEGVVAVEEDDGSLVLAGGEQIYHRRVSWPWPPLLRGVLALGLLAALLGGGLGLLRGRASWREGTGWVSPATGALLLGVSAAAQVRPQDVGRPDAWLAWVVWGASGLYPLLALGALGSVVAARARWAGSWAGRLVAAGAVGNLLVAAYLVGQGLWWVRLWRD